MRCRRLAPNTGSKISPSRHHRANLLGHIFATKACIDNRKKNFLSSNTSSTRPDNMVNFGPLTAEIGSLVCGTPANLNWFRVLAALLHGTLAVGVSQTAALNRGRHLCSTGRPSRWALAHILDSYNLVKFGPGVPRYRAAALISPSLMHLFINQLPSSLRRPRPSPSVSDLPVHAPTTFSHSVNSPLSPSITPVFHSGSRPTSSKNLPSSLRTDYTDYMTAPFLLSISVFSERELVFTFAICCHRSVCLSSVCNARAPYSGGCKFRLFFYSIWYLGHLTCTENFMEIVPGEPLHRGL